MLLGLGSQTSYMSLTYLLAGEICQEWQSWGDYFNVRSILGHSLLQASIYVVLSVRNCVVICARNLNLFTFELDCFCWKCCTVSRNLRSSVRMLSPKLLFVALMIGLKCFPYWK